MKGTINEIWKAMRHAYNQCSADEEIGYKSAMKYLHFLISKSQSFNEWIRAKQYVQQEIRRYKSLNKELYIKIDDLENDNKVLAKRNAKLEKRIIYKSIQQKNETKNM